MVVIGVDTGGTFTDFVYIADGKLNVLKILSTPKNPAEAVLEGLKIIAGDRKKNIVHGSTVATNAILERKGVKTALVTNKGFEDIIEIGRQSRDDIYDLNYKKHPPIVPRDLRFGVKGRVLYTGEIYEDIDEREIEAIADKICENKVESVAVCLLFSYLNNEHELKIKRILERKNIFVSCSHEVLPEFREFERTSTTVLNAYVSPIMKRYISYLEDNLSEGDILRIMQSNGGSISAKTAMVESVRTILSGPAGGAVGAFEIGKLSGYTKIISFDMGGTSTDVSLMDGNLSFTYETKISGMPIKVPMIDIHTVGAGGGSIAYIDEGGALRVGPESAGADPGPICYGKGDKITVTDANLYLGRLVPEYFLGGRMKIYKDRLERYFKAMADSLSMSTVELAAGILEVANVNMERAIRVISVERGYNPEEFVLLCFGGAGGMHAAFLAESLGIKRVLVPENPGILSAFGMLMADVVKDYSITVMIPESEADYVKVKELFNPLVSRARDDLIKEGVKEGDIVYEFYLDMRYKGQSYEITIPFTENFVETFAEFHERMFGYRHKGKPTELVNIRVRAKGGIVKPRIKKYELKGEKVSPDAVIKMSDVYFGAEFLKTPIIERERLVSGNRFSGPAVCVEYTSTVVVPPGWTVFVDEYRNLVLEYEG